MQSDLSAARFGSLALESCDFGGSNWPIANSQLASSQLRSSRTPNWHPQLGVPTTFSSRCPNCPTRLNFENDASAPPNTCHLITCVPRIHTSSAPIIIAQHVVSLRGVHPPDRHGQPISSFAVAYHGVWYASGVAVWHRRRQLPRQHREGVRLRRQLLWPPILRRFCRHRR